ncbi:hypothetical protein [uncultured Chryseobacterium sp.]|uniref:hypothetical protein n=1 Tax=uncultured Chryseobacterium sp. TaxID=259322 RepID=UPI0025D879FF|nr:hypothetical protein [uncultured Chryseobacterium sp.]
MKNLFILLVFLIISCQKKEAGNSIKDDLASVKPARLSNDEFRTKALSFLKSEDQEKYSAILDVLDKQHLSFCNFMKREYEIDDSCYAIARSKYPEPEMQMQFIQCHDQAFDLLHARFLKQIHLTEHQANYLSALYYFNQDIRNFCGSY